MSDSARDLIVIGAGMAGLTAAKLAVQQGLSTQNIESAVFGGLVLNINELDGEVRGSGAELASNLYAELADLGVENSNEIVTGLSPANGLISVTTDQGLHHAKAVVIASGARLKKLGVPGEVEFEHRGVATCADCDGPMYQDQTVVVVGGGDSALQEALVLANYAREVRLLHRGPAFRGRKHFADAVAQKTNIRVTFNTVVEAIVGDENVNAVRVRTEGKPDEIPCNGVFAYVGLQPNSEFAPPQIRRGDDGLLLTDEGMQTAMKNVLAIGAVRAGYGGQLVHAMAEAKTAVAALRQLLR